MVMFVADEVGPVEGIDHYTRYVAGAELNVSLGLSRLGHQVTYVTRLGEDPFGHYIYNLMQDADLDTSATTFDTAHPTGFQLKSKVVEGDPQVVYFRKNSSASRLSPDDIAQLDLSSVNHVHVTGIPLALSASSRAATFDLIERARQAHILLTFDPNLRPSLWSDPETMVKTIQEAASRCDIVFPGIQEGKILTGHADEREIAKSYRDFGVRGVIVKLGAEGAYLDMDGKTVYIPGYRVEKVVDTVGAGDGFAVGVIHGLLNHLPLEEAVRQGNAIGAMQVMVAGDNEGLPNKATLEAFLTQESGR